MKHIGVRTGAEAMCHVLDRGWRADARKPTCPRRAVRAHAPAPVHAWPCTAPAPIRAVQPRPYSFAPRLTSQTQVLAPASSTPPARATRAPATVASHSCRHLAILEPLDSFPVEPWSFSKQEPRPCLTGAAGSPSPDFGHLPPHVDRATRYTIVQLLAPTTSLTSRESLQLTGLSYSAVVRLGSSPPTSFPICARGPTNSDHPRRRPAHRRDRRDLPYVVDHITGAISLPVSPAALFSTACTVPIGEGPRVRFRVT
jgi:hypothetical protein